MTAEPTLRAAAAPPERIPLPSDRALVRVAPERAPRAATAINESLEHLRPWMAWAQEPTSAAQLEGFFAESAAAWDEGRDFTYSIVDRDDTVVLGGAGLHRRGGPEELDIGYWVHVDHVGRGIATDVARALTGAAFAIEGIERVRITCEDTNVGSARVPAKLGFTRSGTWVPEDGVCAGRPTQHWAVERDAWEDPGERPAGG